MTSTDPAPPGPAVGRRIEELFGDVGEPRARWPRRLLAGLLVVAVAVVVASVTVNARAVDDRRYRTATAEVRDVTSRWAAVATVEPVSRAAVGFPVAGTVAQVDVAPGETVTAGQTLATLDTEHLEAGLHEREAALDQAELALARAESGEVGGMSAAAAGTASPATSPSTSGGASGEVRATHAGTTARSPELGAAQRAVRDSQRAVDTARAYADAALAAMTTACDDAAPTYDASACRKALEAVAAAQGAVSGRQQDLAKASAALDALLAELATAITSGATTDAGSVSTTGTAASASAVQLAALQAAVDAAEADVAVAEQAVARATLSSPIAGTVVAVTVAVGDEVTAGSSTRTVTVQGDGGYQVDATAGLSEIGDLAVGQGATFVPDGTDTTLTGKVVAVAVTPLDSSSGTDFRVTIGLDDPADPALRNGATGSASVTTGEATRVLTVPTSAVADGDDGPAVKILEGGTTREASVDVGVVGPEWTEITGALTAGDTVVLADLDAPLPGSATDTTNSSGSGLPNMAGFPGGGPPGGFPGG